MLLVVSKFIYIYIRNFPRFALFPGFQFDLTRLSLTSRIEYQKLSGHRMNYVYFLFYSYFLLIFLFLFCDLWSEALLTYSIVVEKE